MEQVASGAPTSAHQIIRGPCESMPTSAGPASTVPHDAEAASGGRHSRGPRGGGFAAPKRGRYNSQLNREISACGSAQEVCACIEARAAEFDHVNVATAFRKFLMTRRDAMPSAATGSAMRKLEESALRKVADFDAQATGILFWHGYCICQPHPINAPRELLEA